MAWALLSFRYNASRRAGENMDRRDFLKAVPAALAAPLAAPGIREAAAQPAPTRNETLLLVQEYGPNSLDMQGIGSSQPVNGVALNCYDRPVRFKRVKVDEVTTPASTTTRWNRNWPRAGRKPATAPA